MSILIVKFICCDFTECDYVFAFSQGHRLLQLKNPWSHLRWKVWTVVLAIIRLAATNYSLCTHFYFCCDRRLQDLCLPIYKHCFNYTVVPTMQSLNLDFWSSLQVIGLNYNITRRRKDQVMWPRRVEKQKQATQPLHKLIFFVIETTVT